MTSPPPPPWQRFRSWGLVGIGALVVVAGLVTPRLLPRRGEPAPAPEREAAPAKAAPLSVGPESVAAPPVDEQALLLRLGLGTAIVLVLLVATLVVLKRYLVAPPAAGPGGDLRVLGATRLDGRSLVFLVEARGQRLLVGADTGGVREVVLVPRREEGLIA